MSLVFGFDFKSRFPPCKPEKLSVKFRSGDHLPFDDIQSVLIRSLDLTEHASRILRKTTWEREGKRECLYFEATAIPALQCNTS